MGSRHVSIRPANYLFHYLVINSFLLGIIHECHFFFFFFTTNQLVAAGDLSALQVFGFQAGLYNHANGSQADRQPANGGCSPQPDQSDLTRCDVIIPYYYIYYFIWDDVVVQVAKGSSTAFWKNGILVYFT